MHNHNISQDTVAVGKTHKPSADSIDVLIIGAGIAGLMAATRLQKAGRRVLVLDKERGVGGRMATQRIGPGRADDGAQFFTARSETFAQYVQQWQEQGVVYVWGYGWSDGSVGQPTRDGHPRYAGRGGITAVPKHLAQSLNVRTNVTVATVAATSDGWRVTNHDGASYHASALIATPPVPQSLAVLDTGGTVLHPSDRAALERIRYAPTLCGLFWVEGEVKLPEPGAVQGDAEADDVAWIADNQRKGISPEARLITVHAGIDFSRRHFEDKPDLVLPKLWAGLRPFLSPTTTIREQQLKRWRYARPTTFHPERTLLAQDLPPLAFAGDAFQRARVEGAALSGLAAALKILENSPS